MYNISVRKQKRRKRRLFSAGIVIVLLAAAGGVLYRLPVSLQDISRIIQLAAGKFSLPPADNASAGDVLRGTIYDRNFRELSVSYQLFSLYVHPAKIHDQGNTVEKLAEIVGVEKDALEAQIKQSKRVVELADDLDADQVKAIEQLQFEGVYCTSSEKRFYPEHTAASHVLGYTSDGMGLSGVERKYDILLQSGQYQAADAPDVDFQGNGDIGKKSTDLVLTLDIELQKKIDQQLHSLLQEHGAAAGMGLLINPASGRVLAFSNQPSYDPNYFWNSAGVDRQNRLYRQRFDPDLIRPLLIRTAAILQDGEEYTSLLPQTVAAIDFGLSAEEFDETLTRIRFLESVTESLSAFGQKEHKRSSAGGEGVSVMQLGVGLASLINGGWRISPTFLDSVYDQQSGQRFTLRKDAVTRNHVLTPAMGVLVRRELLVHLPGKQEGNTLAHAGKSARVVTTDSGMSRYVQQELFVGMIPKEKPELLLVMALEQNTLAPLQKRNKKRSLSNMGETVLADLYTMAKQEEVAAYPASKNQENFARFLISRRVEYTRSPDDLVSNQTEMPELLGMSLRKGLQRLNHNNIKIVIKGSGQIVAQSPGAGEPLKNVEACLLTLDSEI